MQTFKFKLNNNYICKEEIMNMISTQDENDIEITQEITTNVDGQDVFHTRTQSLDMWKKELYEPTEEEIKLEQDKADINRQINDLERNISKLESDLTDYKRANLTTKFSETEKEIEKLALQKIELKDKLGNLQII